MSIERSWRQKEAATCVKERQIILVDTFVLRKENQFKHHGEFKTEFVDFFKGYFVVAAKNALALSRALAKLTFHVHMVDAVGRGYRPIFEDTQRLSEQTWTKGTSRVSAGARSSLMSCMRREASSWPWGLCGQILTAGATLRSLAWSTAP